MKCPNPCCTGRLLSKSLDGSGARIRIDGAINVGDDGAVTAKCFWCKSMVALPLMLRPEPPAERLEQPATVVERVTVRVSRG